MSVIINKDITTLEEFIIGHYGARGTSNREKFGRGYRKFKAEDLHEMKSYKGGFVRLPGEVKRYVSPSVRLTLNRLRISIRHPVEKRTILDLFRSDRK